MISLNFSFLTVCMCVRSAASSPFDHMTLPPGSSAHGIFQARIVEWDGMSSCRGSPHTVDEDKMRCVTTWHRH